MKKVFQAGNGTFGAGAPKICVPIVAKSRDEIWEKAKAAAALPVDLAEWRVDFYEDADQPEEVLTTLKGIKARLAEKALLFTFRTKEEGGNRAIPRTCYDQLNELAARGGADLVDVEAGREEALARKAVLTIQAAGARVIASHHDFEKTPSVEEMTETLRRMAALGADAVKLAVMPVKRQDVLYLLEATMMADEELSVPVVTMSMGDLGVISRLSGGLTGSAMTFASAGERSAPGQIPVESMAEFFKTIHTTVSCPQA